VLAAWLAACAPVTQRPAADPTATAAEQERQRELALETRNQRQARYLSVALRILAANAALCETRVVNSYGLYYSNDQSFNEEFKTAARTVFNLTSTQQLLIVPEGTAAAAAGLKARDRLLAFDGAPLPKGTEGYKVLREKIEAAAATGAPVQLTIERGGTEGKVTLAPVRICDYKVELNDNAAVNAFADGDKIVVTTGMIRFVESDDELALVVGHELAHNTLGHMKKKMTNAMIGAILGAILSAAIRVDVSRAGADLGAAAYSQDFESEADYAGIYYAARAGFNVADAPKLWRRMAVEHPRAIGHGTTHPNTAVRFVTLEKTVEEIRGKLAANLELKPDMSAPVLSAEAQTKPAANEPAKRDGEVAALRAASEPAKREADQAGVPKEPERLAALTPPITRYDGTWDGEYSCRGGAGYQFLLPRPVALRVQDGNAVFEGGAPDKPGWDRAEGRVREDGQVVMSGKGISNGRGSYGAHYDISLAGRFDGDRFQAAGKLGARDCALDLKRGAR
jgi:hypothetical protein